MSVFVCCATLIIISIFDEFFKKKQLLKISINRKAIEKKTLNDVTFNKSDILLNKKSEQIFEDKNEKIGIYNNYDYYYSNKDKYAEPYTNNFKRDNNIKLEEKSVILNSKNDDIKENNNNNENQDVLVSREQNNALLENQKDKTEIEQSILEKVNTMMLKNNEDVDEKLNTIKTDLKNLKNGIQGMVDRMAQLFELLTITIQNSTK